MDEQTKKKTDEFEELDRTAEAMKGLLSRVASLSDSAAKAAAIVEDTLLRAHTAREGEEAGTVPEDLFEMEDFLRGFDKLVQLYTMRKLIRFLSLVEHEEAIMNAFIEDIFRLKSKGRTGKQTTFYGDDRDYLRHQLGQQARQRARQGG